MNHNDAHNFNQIAHEFDNFEEFNSNVRGWSLRFKQASRGLARVKFRHRMTPYINALNVQFSHSTASFGSSQPGHRTFGVVGSVGCSWCGYDANPNEILRFDVHQEFETYTPPGFVGRTLSVEEGLLASTAEQLGIAGFMERLDKSKDILSIDHNAMNRYLNIYESKMSRETDLLIAVEELIILIENAREDNVTPSQSVTSSHVDSALRYVLENPSKGITVAEICRVLGIGYRTLDRSFKQRLGHGPKDSIMAFRLNGVRDDLKSSDPSALVGDISNAWGFWHLGDFARVYRKEYGELPSETLGSKTGSD